MHKIHNRDEVENEHGAGQRLTQRYTSPQKLLTESTTCLMKTILAPHALLNRGKLVLTISQNESGIVRTKSDPPRQVIHLERLRPREPDDEPVGKDGENTSRERHCLAGSER